MFVNGAHEALSFSLPDPPRQWFLLLDSASGTAPRQAVLQPEMEVPGHSVMVFATRVPAELR